MNEQLESDVRQIASVEVDYRASDRWWMKLINSPSWLLAPACVIGALLMISLLFPLYGGHSFSEAIGQIPVGLAGLAGLCFLAFRVAFELIPLAWEHLSPSVNEPDSKVTFSLQEDGLAIQSELMIATICWPVFESFRSTPDRLFYFLSGRSVYILPRRCFDNDQMYNHWREFSEMKVSQNRKQR